MGQRRSLATQLNEKQVEQLKRQGWGGDVASAELLMLCFQAVMPESPDDVEVWRRIAAENGSGAASGLLAYGRASAGGEQNCLRAKFWYERARQIDADKSSVAVTINLNLKDLAEHWEGCLARGDPQN